MDWSSDNDEFGLEGTTPPWDQYGYGPMLSNSSYYGHYDLANNYTYYTYEYYDADLRRSLTMPTAVLVTIVVAGVGLLSNLLFMALLFTGFVRDRRSLSCPRHWLLLNMCVTHLVPLVNKIVSATMFGSGIFDVYPKCMIRFHVNYVQLVTPALAFCLVIFQSCWSIWSPSSATGIRRRALWMTLTAIAVIWIASHTATYLFLSETVPLVDIGTQDGAITRFCTSVASSERDLAIYSIVSTQVPNDLSCLCLAVFLGLVRLRPNSQNAESGHDTPAIPSDSAAISAVSDSATASPLPDSAVATQSSASRSQTIVFLCVSVACAILMRLPLHIIHLPSVLASLMNDLGNGNFMIVVYSVRILNLVSMIVLPCLCFLLSDIRAIFHKRRDNRSLPAGNTEAVKLEQF